MSSQSKIEWTDATWNPVTGCTKISAGCKFCYAEAIAEGNQLIWTLGTLPAGQAHTQKPSGHPV
jgi:protein gp37